MEHIPKSNGALAIGLEWLGGMVSGGIFGPRTANFKNGIASEGVNILSCNFFILPSRCKSKSLAKKSTHKSIYGSTVLF